MLDYQTYFLLTIIGVIAGFMLDLVGGGADVLIVPLLLLFHIFKKIKVAVGTSILTLMPPITAFAAYRYYKAGNVNVNASIYLAVIYILSSIGFSNFAINIPSSILQKFQSLFIIFIGITSWFIKV